MNLKCAVVLLPFIFFGSARGIAQLSWDKNEIDVKLTIDDAQGIARFPFKNSGKYPVQIFNVETSCPCTTAQSDKTLYNPGDSGFITATYGVGFANGIQDEKIKVTTDDKANSPVPLTMKVVLPEVLKLDPPAVSWKVGEVPSPKTILVDVVTEHEINVTTAMCLPKRHQHSVLFNTKLQTLVPHKQYLVTIIPESTASPTEGVISIVTDYPKFQVKRALAIAAIKIPDQAGK